MSQNRNNDRMMSAISTGFFFVLVGAIFLSTPDLVDKASSFFDDFTIIAYPSIANFYVPAPASVSSHLEVYLAAEKFSLIWGIFEILTLGLKFAFHSSSHSKAQNISDIAFWLGTSYLISLFLTPQATITTWLVFWSMEIILLGASQIIKAIALAVSK